MQRSTFSGNVDWSLFTSMVPTSSRFTNMYQMQKPRSLF